MLKWLFFMVGILLAVLVLVAMMSPKRRRAIHETVQLIAVVLLCVAIVGAAVVYFKR